MLPFCTNGDAVGLAGCDARRAALAGRREAAGGASVVGASL